MPNFLRGASSFVLVLVGVALFLFSAGVASGGDRGPLWSLAIVGTVLAMSGLSLIFAAYCLVRNSDGAPIPAIILKFFLGVGSTFIVVGLIALFFQNPDLPTAYFLMTGCICAVSFVRFRAYTAKH